MGKQKYTQVGWGFGGERWLEGSCEGRAVVRLEGGCEVVGV